MAPMDAFSLLLAFICLLSGSLPLGGALFWWLPLVGFLTICFSSWCSAVNQRLALDLAG